MEEKKALPFILKSRAERILGKAISACYRFNDDNPNIIQCHMTDMSIRYVDLNTKKEVKAAMLNVQVEDTPDAETKKATSEALLPTVDTPAPVFKSKINKTATKKEAQKSTVKKTRKSKK